MVINDKGLIAANSTTQHNVDDRSQVDELVTDINTKKFLADPGYEGEEMYQLLRSKGIKLTIRAPNCPAETKIDYSKQSVI